MKVVRTLPYLMSLLLLFFCFSGLASARDVTNDSSAMSDTDQPAVIHLPIEARGTLDLINAGGPFPFDRDGIVFGNREGRLPEHKRGYYHEYTVPTPGVRSRGARRIIAGAGGERYYTDDHYETFMRIQVLP